VHTVVSSVFGKQFSNMAAKIGSFMRLLMSATASSIAGDTNFLCDGGGLEHVEVVKSTSSKKTCRGGIAAKEMSLPRGLSLAAALCIFQEQGGRRIGLCAGGSRVNG
jgi:hypothetical protein